MRFSIYLILVILLYSCAKPEQTIRERYIVTSRNLNIRSDPSRLSKIIGTLSKGDTIIAVASDKYWIMIKQGNESGFISNEFLKKIEPYRSPFPFNLIDRFSNWKSWSFWVITLVAILLYILITIWINNFETYLKREIGLQTKNLSISPIVFFVSGILTGVLYLFWKDQLIEAYYYKFTVNPFGKEMIYWALLGQILILLAGLIVDLLASVYKSGLRYGLYIFLIEFFENTLVFFVTLYLTISLFLVAIIFLTLFFAMQYITMVSDNGKSFSELLSRK